MAALLLGLVVLVIVAALIEAIVLTEGMILVFGVFLVVAWLVGHVVLFLAGGTWL